MATTINPNLTSDVFGSYRVVHRLGAGGMGEVYLAEHMHIDRHAAVKVLRPEFSANGELVTRFFAEAKAANLIKHPSIVEIYDCSVLPDGRAYIVMEYLEGQTLGSALESSGCIDDFMTFVDLSWQIANALQAAHDKGIVHRDLKPDNIFLAFAPELGPAPVIKILDFGIAKLLYSAIRTTQTGSLLGTPLYMSPEQARGSGTVDHRTDIYAMACIMFEMLTGRPPFVREGMGDIIMAHMSEMPPRASRIKPRIPPEIDQLISRMLAKRPEDRPQSMQEVMAALDPFRVRKSALASTTPFIPELDDGPTRQIERPEAPAIAPAPEAKPRRQVPPTEIIPASEREDQPRHAEISAPRISSPMITEESWIVRAQRTSHGPRLKRPVVKEILPAEPTAEEPSFREARSEKEDRPEPKRANRRLLYGIGLGAIGAVAILAILRLLLPGPKPSLQREAAAPVAAEMAPSPTPSPAAEATPPLAQAAPSPAQFQPPSTVVAPAQPTVAQAAVPAKPKRAPHHSAPPPSELGAEALENARKAYKAGDFIAAGMQAKRSARQGGGFLAFMLLGDCMAQLESYEQAQEAYQSALELDPGNAAAKRKLRTIKQRTSR